MRKGLNMINGIGSTGKGRIDGARTDPALRGTAAAAASPVASEATAKSEKPSNPAADLAALGAPVNAQKVAEIRAAIAEGRPIVIFPEGTRSAPGTKLDYKPGIAALYRQLGVACVPAAVNSGLFWARRGFTRKPGTIILEFLEPIPPGLDRKTFMETLETRVEAATARLVGEAGGPTTVAGNPAQAG